MDRLNKMLTEREDVLNKVVCQLKKQPDALKSMRWV